MPTKKIEDVPADEVGKCVQRQIDAKPNATVTARPNADGATYTVTVVTPSS